VCDLRDSLKAARTEIADLRDRIDHGYDADQWKRLDAAEAEVERLRQLHRDDCEWCSGEQQRRYAVEAERDLYQDELAQLRRALQEGIEEMLALQQTPPEEDGEQP
jgi:hypothetical protein